MTICSLVIQAIPEHLMDVSQVLNAMKGVEIHAQDERGKLIISIDHPSRSYCSEAMTEMTRIEGVMSTSLVFEYQEDLEPNPNQTPLHPHS
jgi:nitrate reductase NapD